MAKKKRKALSGAPAAPAAEAPASSRRLPLFVIAGLVSLCLIVFAQTYTHEFINYDDPDYVTRNAVVQRGLTADGIAWAFTTLRPYYWQPLTWLSHMLDCAVSGLHAGRHLLVNLLLHATSAVLLFLLLLRATGALARSAAVAAIWAVHPLRVESVAWVAERKDVLSTLLFIAAMFAYVWYSERRSPARYALLVVAFLLALMAKPMVVTLPAALLILDLWPLRRLALGWKTLIFEKVPLVALAIVVVALAFVGQSGALAPVPITVRLANALTGYAGYLIKMIAPVNLAVVYPYRYDIDPLAVAGSIALLAAITFFARKRAYLLAGWLWYLITLVPVIGLVQAGPQSMADRFTYIPSIGILFAVVWLVADLVKPRVAVAIASIVTLLFAALAFRQVTFWRDSVSLFTHAIAVTRDNIVAHLSLGQALLARGRGDEANAHYAEAVRLSRGAPLPLAEAGAAYVQQKKYAEAVAPLQQAVAAAPSMPSARENLGVALLNTNRAAEALPHLEEALRLDRGTRAHEIRLAIGGAKLALGRVDEAIVDLEQVVRTHPSGSAYNDLANALGAKGDLAGAERAYREAIRREPSLYDARMNLAALLSRIGRNDDAIVEIRESARLQPSSVEPRIYLALVLANLGRRAEAAAAAEEAMRIDARASNESFTNALRLPPKETNLAEFMAAMRQ